MFPTESKTTNTRLVFKFTTGLNDGPLSLRGNDEASAYSFISPKSAAPGSH